jgi:deoxyribonuclease V
MHCCFDVCYSEQIAVISCVVFHAWDDAEAAQEHVIEMPEPADYVPGEFYKRELPGILELYRQLGIPAETIVIDGYVRLAPNRPGLGMHLYRALAEQAPVIGVAKSAFGSAEHAVKVFRGESSKPLFVTAAGIDISGAAARIQTMHGPFRLPTLIKRADVIGREQMRRMIQENQTGDS